MNLKNDTQIKSLYILSILLLSIFIIINLLSIYYVGPYAWDDGAITLAFGQTLADYGKFALNGASEIVEGTSTILLAAMAALMVKTLNLGFYGLITWSQINTLIFTIITLVLTYKILRPMFQNKVYALLIVSLMSLFPMYTAEIMNGMEMTLFSTLLLLFVITYDKKSAWLYLIIPLLLLTRFEAIFYSIFALSASFIFNQGDRKYLRNIIFYTLLLFVVLSLFRFMYFDDFMPNTIWAKMNPPYSSASLIGSLPQRIGGGIKFLLVFNILFFGCFLFLLKKNSSNEIHDIKLWLILSFFIFSFITGKAAGYSGRLSLAALPLMVIFLTSQLQLLQIRQLKLQLSSQTREWLVSERSKFYLIGAVLVIALIANSKLAYANTPKALRGGFFQNKLSTMISNLEPSWQYRLVHQKFGVSPESYKVTGLAVDEIRKILELDIIKFMVPDVGGLALCCEKIKIIDSALLSNRFLAKNGYAKFAELLKLEPPDIIETHGTWSHATGIYDLDYFREEYVPIIFKNTLLWLNKKYIAKFATNATIEIEQRARSHALEGIRYTGRSIDIKFRIEHIKNYYHIMTKKALS